MADDVKLLICDECIEQIIKQVELIVEQDEQPEWGSFCNECIPGIVQATAEIEDALELPRGFFEWDAEAIH